MYVIWKQRLFTEIYIILMEFIRCPAFDNSTFEYKLYFILSFRYTLPNCSERYTENSNIWCPKVMSNLTSRVPGTNSLRLRAG